MAIRLISTISQLAEQYDWDVASDVLALSRSNLGGESPLMCTPQTASLSSGLGGRVHDAM